eukprot:2527940-Pleurochrysis_carterae.AAC.2
MEDRPRACPRTRQASARTHTRGHKLSWTDTKMPPKRREDHSQRMSQNRPRRQSGSRSHTVAKPATRAGAANRR